MSRSTNTASDIVRKAFQFRIRTALILTAVIAIYLARWSQKARQQNEAVAELSKWGAIVYYDFESNC